jgi:lipopolysaccharide/colanic/teichoic acid biosynthesis glycosyltransferase
MYKLRSMRTDAERGTGAVWARQGDSRITPLGYWLRKLHLDELPQLFNVIRGEMSLIGPRPERPEFVTLLSEEIPGYAARLLVRPGVTGLAQINLPADRDLNDVRRKIVLDHEYIETGSLLLDARILCCTLLRMLGLRGERAMRLMGLERRVEIELGNPHFSVAHVAASESSHASLPAESLQDDVACEPEPVSVGLAESS